jgi:hypothetical protein
LPDIFVYDLLRALGLGGCPLCRALDDDEERWIDSFWREGRQSPAARKQFFAAGGFCRDHAWLLHRLVDAAGSGAAIADLYGQLATNDLRRIEQVAARLAHSRRGAARLRRRRPCPACAFRAAALDRKVQFFLARRWAREPRVMPTVGQMASAFRTWPAWSRPGFQPDARSSHAFSSTTGSSV